MYLVLTIIISIVSVIMIVAICLQEGKSAGLSGSIAGGSENYWSKNKSRSKQGRLERVTVVLAVIFFVAAIALNIGLISKNASASTPSSNDVTVEESETDADASGEDATDASEETEAES